MKKQIKLYTLFMMMAAATSCSDFLDKFPLDRPTTDGNLSEADVIAMVNAAYQPLQWPKLYNMRMWTTDIIAGNSLVGAGGGTDGIETIDLANFNAASNNMAALDIWRGPNPGILRANLVLQEVPKLNISEAIKNRTLGEAHFLRAHYYFILVRFFGGVPLSLKPLTPEDDLRLPRASKEEVYNQIISDCERAIELLPYKKEYASIDLGRACKDAALAMLAKVYLTIGSDYQKVVDLCDQIEEQGYDLTKINYEDNFNPKIDNGPESLFEVQYTGDTNYDFWGNDNQSSWLSTYMGPRNSNMVAGSWGWSHVTQEFVDAYEPGDLRKDITVLYEGCPKFAGMDYNPSYSTTGYNVRKFLVSKSVSPEYNTNPNNFVVYRFADVLLMKAEALNELGKPAEAEKPLNIVRNRAGLGNLSKKSQEEMREIIIKERRIELAFEGHRWFDLIRIKNGDYAIQFFQSIGKNNVTKERLLFPIPQAEIDANKLITQNPGY